MRTSHKLTHTALPVWLRHVCQKNWLRLIVTGLFLAGLTAAVVVRSGMWTAKANEMDAARARLQEAKAQYLASPTKENTANFDKALAEYKAALKANPAGAAEPVQGAAAPYVSGAKGFVVTPRASDLAPGSPVPNAAKVVLQNKNKENELPIRNAAGSHGPDGALQSSIPPGQAAVTNPIQNFDGPDMDVGSTLFGGRFAPPDTNADVGPNHVVVTTNGGVTIYNKTGTVLVPQFKMSQLTPGIVAAGSDDGDPVVLYDPLADRWLLTQFGINTITNGSTHEIIAISQTGDPTGAYYAYDFLLAPNRFGDYPHLGVWPDGYYMSTNDFNLAGTAFLGAGVYSFDRKKMLAGDPSALIIGFSLGTAHGGMLPTDIDGVVPPPAGAPNLFMEFDADEFGAANDLIRAFAFHADFTTPANSTLTQGTDVATAAFDANQPSGRAVVEEPSPATSADYLDVIADRLMHRLSYRNLPGGVQSYVLNFTVNVSGGAGTSAATYQGGIRWMELRRNNAASLVTINQQSTYAPGSGNGATGRNLWMGSIAQDGEGNIGLGASASSTTLIPTAIYTGRLAGDPANTLPQGEVDAMSAVTRGVQTGTGNRWGDYSSMSVDPADECTFWGAFEYVDAPTASFDWNTRVFSFKVNPTCATAAKGSLQGQATNSSLGGAPLSGVTVSTPEGYVRVTNASGNYSFTSAAPNAIGGMAPGTYQVTCSKAGFTSVTGSVTVTGGGTATFNCSMAGAPVIALASSTITSEDCSTDGKADPGENISLSVCFNNTGGANTSNLVATLAATGGVTNPTPASQSYGVVTAGGPAVCKTFSFRVNPALLCGSNVVATFTLADGATNLGTFTVTFQSGSQVTAFTQNFDGVTAPALPSGWTTSTTTVAGATTPLPPWVSSTTTPDTAPNAMFTPDVSTGVTGQGQVNELVSPAFAITTNGAQLSFRNLFNMESGFDGGVLEIKIGAGAFTDIVTAGGAFVTGGYTGTLSTNFGSPLGGRAAWTGLSAGTTAAPAYITTTVNLPAAAAGQNVQFRWRSASDDSVIATGVAGWRVDTVSINDGFSCCVKITPTAKLADPLACTGPGNVVNGVTTVVNPTASTLNNGAVTISLQPNLLAVAGACTANLGTCTVVNSSTILWTGSLPGNATVTINYQAQVGDVQPGTQLCATITGGFTGIGLSPVTACVVVNCPAAGPGLIIPTTLPDNGVAPLSDQKPGSVLLYPVYTSAADANKQNTRLSLTNTHTTLGAQVHLFFVDGATCSVADAFICLTAQQTATFLASDLDPGTTGYMIALAVDRAGCPTSFNYLIGDEYVKFATGHAGNLGAESVPAIAGGSTVCTGSTASVRFDGVAYGPLPRTLALDNIPSRADGNDTLLVVDRINGDLLTTASTLNNLFGILYSDSEIGLSFSLRPGTCQFRSSLTNNFPRVTPRFEQFIPAGRSGWLKMYSTDDMALIGASLNLNSNSTGSAGAFNGAHNLHKMTLTTAASYTVPVLPVSCQ